MVCCRIFEWFKRNSTVPGAVLVFAVTFILVLAMDAGEAGAAWVQATGSVVAIGIAIWIARIQDRQRIKAETQAGNVQAEKVLAIADYIVPRAINACESRMMPDYVLKLAVNRFADDLKSCSSIATKFDMSHIPSVSITVEWLTLIGLVGRVRDDYMGLVAELMGSSEGQNGNVLGLPRLNLSLYPDQLREVHTSLRDVVVRHTAGAMR